MRGHLGRLKTGFGTCSREQAFELGGQRGEQFLFGEEHALILRGALPCGWERVVML